MGLPLYGKKAVFDVSSIVATSLKYLIGKGTYSLMKMNDVILSCLRDQCCRPDCKDQTENDESSTSTI